VEGAGVAKYGMKTTEAEDQEPVKDFGAINKAGISRNGAAVPVMQGRQPCI